MSWARVRGEAAGVGDGVVCRGIGVNVNVGVVNVVKVNVGVSLFLFVLCPFSSSSFRLVISYLSASFCPDSSVDHATFHFVLYSGL